ncbi:MAG: thermonuclease family protein [Anaerolineales bacterium]|nr:thermonuclease family protein [Anaerolineales bacterium]
MYQYKAEIIRVLDGDTMEMKIDLGFYIFTQQNIRILDIDTPETWRPSCGAEKEHGEAATKRAKELLEGETITLISAKKGKYRFVGTIILPDGRDYATIMKEEGFEKKESYE